MTHRWLPLDALAAALPTSTLLGVVALVTICILGYLLVLSRMRTRSLDRRCQSYKSELNDLTGRNRILTRERDDAEHAMRTTRFDLLKIGKTLRDQEVVIRDLQQSIEQGVETGMADKQHLEKMLRILRRAGSGSEDTFQIHMDGLNQDFVNRLKDKYPALTVYDLRLCTYIKTGLSSKEIAQVMNVLPSSINVSRSRLRKKLGLDVKDDLYSILVEFGK